MATYKVTVTYKSGKTLSTKKFSCGHDANSFAGKKFNAENVRGVEAVKFPDEGTPITMLAFSKNISPEVWLFPHKP
jgi:hypothetical protein